MFLQDATPDTSGYMIAGYAIAFLVMILYVASLYLRRRNLDQDLAMLEELDQSAAKVDVDPPKPTKPAKSVTKKGRQKQP